MIVTEIDDMADLLALREEWNELQRSSGTLPFTSFEWTIAWWNQFARRRLHVTDHLAVRTIRCCSGKLVAVAPLMLTALPTKRPLGFRFLQFMGADPNITEIRGMLARPEIEAECYDSLLEHLMQHSHDWDWIVWGGIPERAVARLCREGQPLWLPNVPYFLLDLPSTWEEFKSTRSRNIKESLRKCSNSLKRAGLHAVFKVADRGPELKRKLDELVRLHAMRAARTDTVQHPNVFATANATRFLSEVCARCETRGGVRVFSLEVEGRTCAARLAFPVGDSLYLSYSGYDLRLGQHSVMTTVVAEAIKYAIQHGFRTVNLSTGSDQSKTRWSPRQVESKVAMMPSRAGRARFAMTLYNELRRPFAPPDRAAAFPSMIHRPATPRTELSPGRAA